MRVKVNGEALLMSSGRTVAELVAELVGDGRGIAVAVGGSVVPRTEWAKRVLDDGEAVELLTAVQGG